MDAGSFVIALLAAAGTAAGPTGSPVAAAPAPRCIAAPPVGNTDPSERRSAAAGPLDTGTADDDRSTGRPGRGSELTDAADALEQLAAALRADAARADPARADPGGQTDDGTGSTGLADQLDELDADRQSGVGADRTDTSLRDRLSDDRPSDDRPSDLSLDREGLDGTGLDPDQGDPDQGDPDQRATSGSRAAEVDGQGRLDDDLLVARVVDQLADRLAEEESPACGSAAGSERSTATDDDLGATAPGRGQGSGRADPDRDTGTGTGTGTGTSSADRQQDDRGTGSRIPTDLDEVLARSAAERERAEDSGIAAALDRGERGTG